MRCVECPRCRLRLSAKLHAITTTDAQECPRCWGLERIEIPMMLAKLGPRPGTVRGESVRPFR